MGKESFSAQPPEEICEQCCSMKLAKYHIEVRSFHPNAIFNETVPEFGTPDSIEGSEVKGETAGFWGSLASHSIGGPFHGDNRGFTAKRLFSDSFDGTSRVEHHYQFDTATGSFSKKVKAASDDSAGLGYMGVPSTYPQEYKRTITMPTQDDSGGPLYPEHRREEWHGNSATIKTEPEVSSDVVPDAKLVRFEEKLNQDCYKSWLITTHHFGINMATPWYVANAAVPDLDVFAKITFYVDRSKQTLRLEGTIMGDGFPNCDVIVADENDKAVLLGGYVRQGSPLTQLTGVKSQHMFSFNVEIKLDANGLFADKVGGGSLSDWNKNIEGLNPNNTNNPRSFISGTAHPISKPDHFNNLD